MQVLLVEDNPDHAELVMDCVQEAYNGNANIDWHTELQPALKLLADPSINDYHFDVCLCDLQLPDSNIDDTIESLKKIDTRVPILVLTSLNDQEKAKSLLKCGIQDYLSKENLDPRQFYRTCTYAIQRKHQTVQIEEKNRDQAAFCYSLSHDFKGPLRRIETTLGFLKEDLSQRIEFNPEEEAHFTSITNNVNFVKTLTSDLYQYLNLENNFDDFTEVDLNDVATEAKALLGETQLPDAQIKIADLPKINGNRSQLIILFRNLIDNAIKYSGDFPIVTIRKDIVPSDQVVVISISDNGAGIDPKKIDKIFVPFNRLQNSSAHNGTGLGLSIVKRVADNHNARIHVKSELNKGTTVSVNFPLVPKSNT